MSAEPRSAKDLFIAALELPDAAARAALLDRECGSAPELRRRVEALLVAHENPTSVVDRPLVARSPEVATDARAQDPSPTVTFGTPPATELPSHPGTEELIGGRYKLKEEIGTGGMGTVWVAQQVEPVRRAVAVKLIKAGMDSKAVLARFEAERQALAVMDHPNIARVLDGGATPDGRPFFVMELVKGVPITAYCDARKLTPRQRLELFVPVCQAIQHAHQKGVIHRDIKPSNVLVALYDDRPVPKVIDFGIAKATGSGLTDHTLLTGFGAVVGTPEYMSPEQASLNNLDIDTRSDVYALGVLLYELLAGSTPFRSDELKRAGLLEMLRVVREEEPPRPSAKLSTANARASLSADRGTEPAKLTGMLRHELDWIVMRALEKDRARRYETANGFAQDVQRYLNGDPVQAVPPSAAYRLRKFLRRHRGLVAAVGVVALALVAGVIATAHQASRARLAEAEAWDNARAEAQRRTEAETARVESQAQSQRAERERDDKVAALSRAERLLYIGQINHAQRAAEDLRTTRLGELLADTTPAAGRPDLRGWEWHYLNRLTRSWDAEVPLDFRAVPGLAERVSFRWPNGQAGYAGFAFTADGSRLLIPPYRPSGDRSEPPAESAGAVIDVPSGKLVRVIPVPTAGPLDPRDVTFSPDGAFMGFPDPLPAGQFRARVVELATGQAFDPPIAPLAARFRIAMTAEARRVVVYEPRSPLPIRPQDRRPVLPVSVWERGKPMAQTVVVHTSAQAEASEAAHVLPVPGGATLAVLRDLPMKFDASGPPREMPRSLELWDLTANPPAVRATVAAGTRGVGVMVASANGKYLAITDAATDAIAVGYEVATGRKATEWVAQGDSKAPDPSGPPRPGAPKLLSLSDDGRRFVQGEREGILRVSDNEVAIPSPVKSFAGSTSFVIREPVHPSPQGPSSDTEAAWLSADGNRLVTAGAGALRVWTLGQKPGYSVAWPQRLSLDGGLSSFQPDPRQPVAVVYESRQGVPAANAAETSVAVYDAAAGRFTAKLTASGSVAHGVRSPDGRRLLLGIRPAELKGPVPFTNEAVEAWSLRALDRPDRYPEVVRFDPPAAPARGRWAATELPRFTPDNRWLIEPVIVRPVVDPTDLSPHSVIGFNLRRTSDGAVAREVRYANEARILAGPVEGRDGKALLVVTFAPGRAATDPGTYTLFCYNAADGGLRWQQDMPDPPSVGDPPKVAPRPHATVRISPDGSRVAVARKKQDAEIVVRVWDAASGQPVRTVRAAGSPPFGQVPFAITAGGWLAVADHRELIVWDAEAANPVHRINGHNGRIGQVLFSADGRRLFVLDNGTNSLFDRAIRVWDSEAGRELLWFRVPTRFPPGLSLLSPEGGAQNMWLDGERLCVPMGDGVRVFDGTPLPNPKRP